MKRNADAKVCRRIHDFSRGLEEFAAGIDSDGDGCARRKWIDHVHIAAIKAEFADPSVHGRARGIVAHRGVCNEGIPGSTAPLFAHEVTPRTKLPDYKPSEPRLKESDSRRCGRSSEGYCLLRAHLRLQCRGARNLITLP